MEIDREGHAIQVGALITLLQQLEFVARRAIAKAAQPQFSAAYLRTIQPGDVVPKDPLNDYRTLWKVLEDFNEHAHADRQLDVRALVDLRDQLAHGRVTAFEPKFPLTLLKFAKPSDNGQVRLLAKAEMTAAWFSEGLNLVKDAIDKVRVVEEGGEQNGQTR